MIVMKFGGASLASPASIQRVAALVRSHQHRHPVVVVSALGDTTDHLVDILQHACRAESYCGLKAQENLKNYHFSMAEDLLSGELLDDIQAYIRLTFRELHIRMLELSEGECSSTPELRDWVLSLGEQLSSRIMTSVLCREGVPAIHKDARQLILTDDHFTNAQPRHWESYARLRWSLSLAAREHFVVLGGFMGATEDGRTTTLRRGGSDLTASLVGAAVNAEEIQVWKDVDGLLTWNPRLKSGAYRVKHLSYSEATELAWAGATVLHPDTMAPAQRLRIPIVIRNTFKPEGEGTTIDACSSAGSGIVKSIACQTDITLLELRLLTGTADWAESSQQLDQLCKRNHISGTLLGTSEKALYLSLPTPASTMDTNFNFDGCVEAHLRNHQTVITFVGQDICRTDLMRRIQNLLSSLGEAVLLPASQSPCSFRMIVPHAALSTCLEVLRRTLFTNLDPHCFDVSAPATLWGEALPVMPFAPMPDLPVPLSPQKRNVWALLGSNSC